MESVPPDGTGTGTAELIHLNNCKLTRILLAIILGGASLLR